MNPIPTIIPLLLPVLDPPAADSERLLEQALVADPHHVSSLCLRGAALSRRGRHAEARTLLKTAVGLAPEQSEVLSNYGACLSESGDATDLAQAEACYLRAMELSPHSCPPAYNLASLLYRRRDLSGAERLVRHPHPLLSNTLHTGVNGGGGIFLLVVLEEEVGLRTCF